MELKLENGKYSLSPAGIPETVSGAEELAQRIAMRLTARRGEFWPEERYGSRLFTLGKLKPSQRATAAREFVEEALLEERDVSVTKVEYKPLSDGEAEILAELKIGGETATVSLRV